MVYECVFCAPCSVYCNIICSDCVTFFAFLFAWIWLSTVHSTDRTLPKNILDLSVVSCYLSSRCPISQSSSSSSHELLRLLLQAVSVYTGRKVSVWWGKGSPLWQLVWCVSLVCSGCCHEVSLISYLSQDYIIKMYST